MKAIQRAQVSVTTFPNQVNEDEETAQDEAQKRCLNDVHSQHADINDTRSMFSLDEACETSEREGEAVESLENKRCP